MTSLQTLLDLCGALARPAVARTAIGRTPAWLPRAFGSLLAALSVTACGPGFQTEDFCGTECLADYAVLRSATAVDPASRAWQPGDTVTASVTVVYPAMRVGDLIYVYSLASLRRAGADEVGVTTSFTTPSVRPCVRDEIPDHIFESKTTYRCAVSELTVQTTTAAVRVDPIGIEVRLLATFEHPTGNPYGGPVEFPAPGGSLTLVQPSFELAVVPLATVYATQGTTSVRVERDPRFDGPVTLALDDLGSGILGSFSPNPVPAGIATATLQLDIPARYAGGGAPNLLVRGSNGGIQQRREFRQLIAPLYTLSVVAPSGGTGVLTRRQPLDLEITVAFDPSGPFGRIGPGRIDLTLPDPPPDVLVQWLPDSQPVSADPATLLLRRTLRLTAQGDDGFSGNLEVRATAAQIPADGGGVQPFAAASLPLQLDFAYSWEHLESSAQYFQGNNDSIGLALQSSNRPAVAWLEGEGDERKAFLKRYDGTAFLPSPGAGARGLAVAGGRIEQARMAMTRDDVARVAFTYRLAGQDGARIGLGVASPGASDWTVQDALVSLPAGLHARSPRLAGGRYNDAVALSYIVETGIPAAAGALLVRSRLLAGSALVPLPDPLRPDGSINASGTGQVLRDTPSIALRHDGHPGLAWMEEETAPTRQPPALWLRGHDGSRWSAPVRVTRMRPLTVAPTQLLFESASSVMVVAWLESNPARLMLARVDPATGNFAELRDDANPLDGALNVTATEPARDIALALDQGRLVVSWTEGPPTRPLLYAKRHNADGTWTRLGAAIDASRPTRSPFIVGDDSTGRIHAVWTGFSAGTDPLSTAPVTDILIGRSVSP